jgi:hypothetical protein
MVKDTCTMPHETAPRSHDRIRRWRKEFSIAEEVPVESVRLRNISSTELAVHHSDQDSKSKLRVGRGMIQLQLYQTHFCLPNWYIEFTQTYRWTLPFLTTLLQQSEAHMKTAEELKRCKLENPRTPRHAFACSLTMTTSLNACGLEAELPPPDQCNQYSFLQFIQ